MLNSALQMTQGALKSSHPSGLVERFTRLTNDLTTEPILEFYSTSAMESVEPAQRIKATRETLPRLRPGKAKGWVVS